MFHFIKRYINVNVQTYDLIFITEKMVSTPTYFVSVCLSVHVRYFISIIKAKHTTHIQCSMHTSFGEHNLCRNSMLNLVITGLNEIRAIGDEQLKDEYVAVATFGHETNLQLLLSVNYDSVQETVGKMFDYLR